MASSNVEEFGYDRLRRRPSGEGPVDFARSNKQLVQFEDGEFIRAERSLSSAVTVE